MIELIESCARWFWMAAGIAVALMYLASPLWGLRRPQAQAGSPGIRMPDRSVPRSAPDKEHP